MKNKVMNALTVGAGLFIVILLFTIVDHTAHSLEDAWSVPDYYFRNKIPFGFLWAIVGYFITRKIESIWLKSAILSGFVATILQTRYFLEGYPLDFVLIFLCIHFVILFVFSVMLYVGLGSLYKNNQSISMKNTIVIIVVLILVAIGAYYLVFSNPAANQNMYAPTPTETTVSEMTTMVPSPSSGTAISITTKVSTASDVQATIANFKFVPETITVKAGTQVTWTNEDSAPHTVTSDTGTMLNSPRLAQGDSYSFTFTTPGTYAYHCAVHPMMKGTVIVK